MIEAGRIRDKLALVRERRVETFGAKAHGYQLAPALDEGAVRALEERLGATLPDAYRRFVREVGASGAGPYYGIVAPARWGDALYGDVAMPDYAARPCPFTPGQSRDDAERIRDAMDEPFQGAITIADQGCAYYATLVVTGEARGRVMYVSLDGGAPFFPDDVDFLAWYERWVDELLAGFTHFWFGIHVPGTEASFAAAAREADGPRRLPALRAMTQLPTLTADTRAVVALRVRDRDPAVRAVALALAKQFAFAGAIEVHVRRALADDQPYVRTAALAALIASGGPWHDAARAALGDPDDDVVERALRELATAKALGEADLLPLLGSPSQKVRSAAQLAGRAIASPAIFDATLADLRANGDGTYHPLLVSLLAQVRLDAVDAERRAIVLDLVAARIAQAADEPPSPAIAGLAALAPRDPRAFALLVELTRHPHAYYRFEAAAALGELGDPAALPVLRALVDDPAMPRTPSRSTAWSVGHNAGRAIAKIEAKR